MTRKKRMKSPEEEEDNDEDKDEDSTHAIFIADLHETKANEGEREAPSK